MAFHQKCSLILTKISVLNVASLKYSLQQFRETNLLWK